LIASRNKTTDEYLTDETRSAGDENTHSDAESDGLGQDDGRDIWIRMGELPELDREVMTPALDLSPGVLPSTLRIAPVEVEHVDGFKGKPPEAFDKM
jgi:hypothetical protein